MYQASLYVKTNLRNLLVHHLKVKGHPDWPTYSREKGVVNRGGADSDVLMNLVTECSEKPVLPGFSEENQA